MLDRIILFPYYLSLKIRDFHYRRKKDKLFRPNVPVICVGNVTVGGTGKTPHVEMILRMLLESEEWKQKNVSVLSLGYKRKSRGFQNVVFQGSATFFGDEPSQIKSKFPNVTVAVDKNRVEGCKLLCEPEVLQKKRKYSKCQDKNVDPADIIVLDDAFQYRKLNPDKTIVLVDYNRPVFNDSLLPFGKLRDLPERIYQADILIVSKCNPNITEEEKVAFAKQQLCFDEYDPASCEARKNDRIQKLFFTKVEYSQVEPVFEQGDPHYMYSKGVILFSGIANDKPLRAYLTGSYKIVKRLVFPDHHKYNSSDFAKISKAAKRNPTSAIVTTEKDAQRVLAKDKYPQQLRPRTFVVPIKAEFITEEEEQLFRKEILTLS